MTAPCCGCTLQTGTMIIAILMIIGGIAGISLSAYGFYFANVLSDPANIDKLVEALKTAGVTDEDQKKFRANFTSQAQIIYAASGIGLAYSLFQLMVNIVLLTGTEQRDYKRVKIAFIGFGILVLLEAIPIGLLVSQGYASIIQIFVSLARGLYFMSVIYCFMKELKGREINAVH